MPNHLRFLGPLLLVAACASGGSGDPASDDTVTGPDACAAETERCNGIDDDCDDQIDELYGALGMDCEVGVGECTAAGVYVCNDAEDDVFCDATSGTPQDEL